MNEYGGYTTTIVPYDKGYNTIYSLKNRIDTTKEKSRLIKPLKTSSLDNDEKMLQNKNDNNIISVIGMLSQRDR